MSQSKQYKKVKLYRALKVIFYMLGLPLFIGVVFCSAVKFMGHEPFLGTAEFTGKLGFFMTYEKIITAPGLYGLYIAFGIWAFISLVHIILSKLVKNPRARMFAVVALVMVVMLGGALVMDAVFEAKITEMQANAPEGVTINDYKTQLSYYRTISTGRLGASDTKAIIKRVNELYDVYNCGMDGSNDAGAAGNISNKPVSYAEIISDSGVVGVDIGFEFSDYNSSDPNSPLDEPIWQIAIEDASVRHRDGAGNVLIQIDGENNMIGDGQINDIERDQLVKLAPNSNGELVINGEVYSHYCFRSMWDDAYVWYTKEMFPLGTVFDGGYANGSGMMIDGIYGLGSYNRSGLVGDGYEYGLLNIIEILEDYYYYKQVIDELDPTGIVGFSLHKDAVAIRDGYYRYGIVPEGAEQYFPDEIDDWWKAMYDQEVNWGAKFSLTRGELDYLLSKVGGLLGNNSLFDFLLKMHTDEDGEPVSGLEEVLSASVPSLATLIGPILKQLNSGMSLGSLGKLIKKEDTMNTVADILKAAVGCEDESVEINEWFILVSYAGTRDCMGVLRDGLYVAVVKDSGIQDEDGNWLIGTNGANINDGGDVLLDLDFRDVVVDAANDDYVFGLDHLSKLLNTAVNGLLKHINFSTIGKLIGGLILKDIDVDGTTMKGLVISGISIPLFDTEFNLKVDVTGIIMPILEKLYSYQSSMFKPIWEFYECQYVNGDDDAKLIAEAYANYERASYIVNVHSKMIGSALSGDTLGAGTYPSSFGLNSLESVRQLRVDLSYKPIFYPLYALRDMLMLSCGFTVLFYFMSFVAAQKELEYATGKLVVKERVRKSKKKAEEENADATNEVGGEKSETPVDQNNGKEVK